MKIAKTSNIIIELNNTTNNTLLTIPPLVLFSTFNELNKPTVAWQTVVIFSVVGVR